MNPRSMTDQALAAAIDAAWEAWQKAGLGPASGVREESRLAELEIEHRRRQHARALAAKAQS